MEYRWEKPPREDRYRHQRENPSFSSTLLDAIYRSIDESNGREEEEAVVFYRETMRKKQNNNGFREEGLMRKEEEMTSFQRACMIENWMEKKVSYQEVPVRRKSTAGSVEKPPGHKYLDRPVLLNSSSSSSESSSGGGFSSSESESFHGHSSKSSTAYSLQRPRPIRTSISTACPDKDQRQIYPHHHHHHHQPERKLAPTQKSKHEGGLGKTKSKALKIYGDLKKVKQPISPGGRLASFLNSLFTTGYAKKAKTSSSSSGYDHERKVVKSELQESTCSSASSFSRSCLSKTPSSRGKLSNNGNGAKRSVRFYPVSVIVDEDSRPCGHKSLYGSEETLVAIKRNSPINEELKFHVMSENLRVEKAARDLLKNYHNKKEQHIEDEELGISEDDDDDEDEDDDDGASYASSDLFELDNLSSIGIDQRYREELPVYETTHLGTNRAIANGLIV